MAEIEKYFPGRTIFRALQLSGNIAGRQSLWQQNESSRSNIVVTSYAVLRSDIEYLEHESFCYCILDEGHLMKNAKTGKPKRNPMDKLIVDFRIFSAHSPHM